MRIAMPRLYKLTLLQLSPRTQTRTHCLPTGLIRGLAPHPDRMDAFLTAGSDGCVYAWDVRKRQEQSP